jgi:hypothetical protein
LSLRLYYRTRCDTSDHVCLERHNWHVMLYFHVFYIECLNKNRIIVSIFVSIRRNIKIFIEKAHTNVIMILNISLDEIKGKMFNLQITYFKYFNFKHIFFVDPLTSNYIFTNILFILCVICFCTCVLKVLYMHYHNFDILYYRTRCDTSDHVCLERHNWHVMLYFHVFYIECLNKNKNNAPTSFPCFHNYVKHTYWFVIKTRLSHNYNVCTVNFKKREFINIYRYLFKMDYSDLIL